jgi:hypothetical protein
MEQEENRFLAFLQRKNIDAAAFSAADPEFFNRWAGLFAQQHEESFLMQQKFHINPIRRRFPLVVFESVTGKEKSSPDNFLTE